MSSPLLLLQCPACLLRLNRMACVMGGRWLFNYYFFGCCFQDLFKIGRGINVFFSMCFASVHLVHLYRSTDTDTAWKKSRFIISDRSDFHMIDNLSIVVHAFAWCMLTPLSKDEILLPRYVNWSTKFRGFPLKLMISVLFAFT